MLRRALPKPMELKYSCIEVTSVENQDQRPDDVPIILLHGLTGSKESWNGIFEVLALETKKEACIVDLRNHGESPWNNEEYDVVAMTEDIKHLLDRLKAPKAIILGHSLGGKIAIHLALNYLNPSFKPFETTEFIPIKCSDGKCQFSTNPVLFDTVLRNIDELNNESSGQFDGPALFIYGGQSETKLGDEENNVKKLFPKAKLVEVEEAGHVVHTFKQFTIEVIKFINDK
ncbi:unnamed protein product [Larinioides sclopetarius]|uniref:sn-1-specific diacylglycerol lipase ABHD11 n=1 Tax=Larinioides sclopetarius TaxID=280406 RepID=A0AAV1ZRL5_9ARAC